MDRVATAPWSDDPRDGQDPSSDAAKRDRRSMPRIRSNVVIRCILHHVRNLSLRDPTAGVIDEHVGGRWVYSGDAEEYAAELHQHFD
jgi:hypothetical protein